jgi:hypothetical protein
MSFWHQYHKFHIPVFMLKSKMQDTQEKKAVNKIILEEIERINKTIPIHTNGFVETYDTRDEPVYMAIKIIPSGLLAVFYGEDACAMAPDPAKPFYTWHYLFSQQERESIEQNAVDYSYDIWFDLWFEITERIESDILMHWFPSLEEARRYAEKVYRMY